MASVAEELDAVVIRLRRLYMLYKLRKQGLSVAGADQVPLQTPVVVGSARRGISVAGASGQVRAALEPLVTDRHQSSPEGNPS